MIKYSNKSISKNDIENFLEAYLWKFCFLKLNVMSPIEIHLYGIAHIKIDTIESPKISLSELHIFYNVGGYHDQYEILHNQFGNVMF